jgi:hypothetical protein
MGKEYNKRAFRGRRQTPEGSWQPALPLLGDYPVSPPVSSRSVDEKHIAGIKNRQVNILEFI